MYSCDIESLYISIRTELVLEAIEYWIMRKRGLIPQRFTKEYILESIEFILKNKNFSFDSEMFNQIIGTAMRTKCAPPYACLTIGYQEETKLFTQELIQYFSNEECLLFKEFFKRYMDVSFIFWPKYLDFNSCSICLHNLHPAMKYTFEKTKVIVENSEFCQVINFLDVSAILHSDCTIETDIYYKDINSHDYLPNDSTHTYNSKDNVPYNAAKWIIAFVSNEEKIEYRLNELKNWLKSCKYPENVINRAFRNARLQGPAPLKTNSNNIPFVTTYYDNVNNNEKV